MLPIYTARMQTPWPALRLLSGLQHSRHRRSRLTPRTRFISRMTILSTAVVSSDFGCPSQHRQSLHSRCLSKTLTMTLSSRLQLRTRTSYWSF